MPDESITLTEEDPEPEWLSVLWCEQANAPHNFLDGLCRYCGLPVPSGWRSMMSREMSRKLEAEGLV